MKIQQNPATLLLNSYGTLPTAFLAKQDGKKNVKTY
jgi:hypothetical protein